MASPLQQLGERGQSVWLDYISRDLLTSGELQRLIDTAVRQVRAERGVKGKARKA